jgi:hypothetical protein
MRCPTSTAKNIFIVHQHHPRHYPIPKRFERTSISGVMTMILDHSIPPHPRHKKIHHPIPRRWSSHSLPEPPDAVSRFSNSKLELCDKLLHSENPVVLPTSCSQTEPIASESAGVTRYHIRVNVITSSFTEDCPTESLALPCVPSSDAKQVTESGSSGSPTEEDFSSSKAASPCLRSD